MNFFDHQAYGDQKTFIATWNFRSPHDWWQNAFSCQALTENISSLIVWRLNVFSVITRLWIWVVQLIVDWSPPLIWLWNLIWWQNLVCMVIKCKPCMSILISPLRCVDLVLFNTNNCHIPWEGGVKPLWVFEFQIVILHLQLVLNFNCNPRGEVWSYCWRN